ncbi:AbrB/MazE/SpoVT family DNA-binding domain-containing protein [Natronoarchaeum mannanilyticum]|uniref:SpoVT-AbrB domain-containing protein n=1 Tax=Natronoarchaeum mannanilyticum TaxID=926360 RepID=A0AAV3TCY4_9EURY|nr:AbrB/MazE/SpoVT family DNA-binding domain-containing protein [Natronoarchaeum rubrum]HMB51159.1 AbrB/MazE/SpoVT family DNA-binding domain-containing protein [Natronoarchaeum rubrum]
MTDDSSGMQWPPALFAEQMQEAGEQAVESQQELMKQFLSANAGAGGNLSQFPAMTMGTATFKTRVQSGGRISIPDAEREALDIDEGDIVQTIVIPLGDTNE